MARKKSSRSKRKSTSKSSAKGKSGSRKTSSSKSKPNSRGKSSSKSSAKGKSKTTQKPRSKGKKRQPQLPKIQVSKDAQLDIVGYGMLGTAALTILGLLSAQRGVWMDPWVSLLSRIFGWGVYIVPFFIGAVGLYLVLRRFGEKIPRPELEQIVGVLLLFVALLVALHFPATWFSGRDRTELARLGQGGGWLGASLGDVLVGGLGGTGAALVIIFSLVISVLFVLGVSPAEMFRELSALYKRIRQSIELRRATQPHLPTMDDRRPITRPRPTARAKAEAETKTALPEPVTYQPPPTQDIDEYVHPRIIGEQPWQLPMLDAILEWGDSQDLDQEMTRQQVQIIEKTLETLGAPVKVREVNQGPVITQFCVEPLFVPGSRGRQTRVKVSKITGLADDVALALSAKTIRVQAPIPKKGLVGIEIPNQQISLVALRDIVESDSWRQVDAPLRLGLGQDVSGTAVVSSLATMPHLLIAGATGSGKSVCINSILAALLLENTPSELKLLMVDPKRVELTQYNGIPHLLAPVIVDIERVPNALSWVMREMEGRYRKFADVGARDIYSYNEEIAANNPEKKPIPFIAVVIDELADLMILSPQETEKSICRLAQMSRATGIHMIIATQRPSVDVVTGLIKANFPTRIAFAVASTVDSRVILDTPGAERLLGRGDMLFVPPDAPEPIRLQGAYVSDEELRRLVRYWKGGREFRQLDTAAPQQRTQPVQLPLQGEMTTAPVPTVKFEDDLFPDAIGILLAENRASISLLQRKLRIGYTRSARIIDLLAEKGIVGPPQPGGKAREIDRVKAEELLRQAGLQ